MDVCAHAHCTLYDYCAYFVGLIFAVSRLSAGKNCEIGPLENSPLYNNFEGIYVYYVQMNVS
jgi:hypothetical protein